MLTLCAAIEAFLLTKQVGGCTQATIRTYRWWLGRFAAAISEVSPLAVRTFFAGLQHHSASHQHQAYRTLKTFFRWGLEAGLFLENPLRGFTMRVPRTLPVVPTEDDLRAVLAVCPQTLEGVRNRGLILTLADAGLRASEALHLLIEDWRPTDRGLFVRAGKGRKDRVAFVGATTTRALKAWLARHPVPSAESFLFTDRRKRPVEAPPFGAGTPPPEPESPAPGRPAPAPACPAPFRCYVLAARRGGTGRGAQTAWS